MEVLFDILPEPLAERIVVRIHRGDRHGVEQVRGTSFEGGDTGARGEVDARRCTAVVAVDRSGFTATLVASRAEAPSRQCILSLCQHHCVSAGIVP